MSQLSYDDKMAIGYAGMLADVSDHDVCPGKQAEVSAEIPFGVMLVQGTNNNDAKLPSASTDKPIGVLLHSHTYSPGIDLSDVGVKPGALLNVLNRGRVYVTVEENVTKEDRAYVRYASGAGGTQLGAFRKSSVSGETIDVTKKARFMTSALAGGLAVVEIDMLNA